MTISIETILRAKELLENAPAPVRAFMCPFCAEVHGEGGQSACERFAALFRDET